MELLSGSSIEELKGLFKSGQSYNKNNFIEKNGKFINKNIRLESLDEERFEPHPNIPVQASNYGNIKYNGKILEQRVINGYTTVSIPYEIDRLVKETQESTNDKNTIITPIVEEAIEYEKNREYSKRDYFKEHPFIFIGVKKSNEITNILKKKRENSKFGSYSMNENQNFCKVFKEKENNGIKYVEIPIYVYRLVAETWLENPDYKEYKTVHHISNNRHDNTIYNLMWVTKEQHEAIQFNIVY